MIKLVIFLLFLLMPHMIPQNSILGSSESIIDAHDEIQRRIRIHDDFLIQVFAIHQDLHYTEQSNISKDIETFFNNSATFFSRLMAIKKKLVIFLIRNPLPSNENKVTNIIREANQALRDWDDVYHKYFPKF